METNGTNGVVVTSVPEADGTRITIEVLVNGSSQGIERPIQAALLTEVLRLAGGNMKEVARILGLCLKTVYNRYDRATQGTTANRHALTREVNNVD